MPQHFDVSRAQIGRVIVSVLACAAAAPADERQKQPATHVVAAGPHYQAGALYRLIWGAHYRELWASPIRVEVLDLATFSGGLTPDKKGGGKQTRSLSLKGRDGREWRFRSVDKDPTAALPPGLRDTFVDKLAQDQISAEHPGGPLLASSLEQAAGVLSVDKRLYVMPDDARLGEFRSEFAGLLGYLEQDVSVESPVTPGFEAYDDIEETVELWETLDQDPAQTVDSRALLKARLLDVLMGDYDRHKDQWDWARLKQRPLWQPVPKDRDLAFVRFDGLALEVVRKRQPRLVVFSSRYGDVDGLVWQGRFVDRRHLTNLEWAAWQPVIAELQEKLSDSVIDAAIGRMPPEYQKIEGQRQATRLKSRRRLLPDAAREFYELLTREAEVHGTDKDDVATILRRDDGSVEVRVGAATNGGAGAPYFQRSFLPGETKEVRVFLKGGDDRAASLGLGTDDITVRVIGGAGSDTLDDSQGGRTHFYDSAGENRIVKGPGTEESNQPYRQPVDRDGNPLRDFGRRRLTVPWVKAGGDLGVLIGAEMNFIGYGFRKHPWAQRHSLRAGYATGLAAGRAEYEYEWLRTNSRKRGNILLRASELELIRFHGFGNETDSLGDSDFFRVEQRQYALGSSFFRLGLDEVDLSLGLLAKYTTTESSPDRFISILRPYGSEDFGEVGVGVRFVVDNRDQPKAPTRGIRFASGATYFPPVWSVESSFGELHGEASTYLSPPIPLAPTFAFRIGGQHVFGRYPYHEAAFLGGPDNVRGLRRQRFAGDSSLFANGELRLRLAETHFAGVRAVGVFGFVDRGRVFFEGESSDRWHTGVGGGLWLAVLKPEHVVSIAAARSEGKLRLYVQSGFMF